MSNTTIDQAGEGTRPEQSPAQSIDTTEYTERLELLYEVVQKASSVEEVSGLLEDILSIIQRILRASAASLFLVDQDKQELYVPAAGGQVADALRQVRIDFFSGVVGWVANHAAPVMIGDVTTDTRFNRDVDKATGFVTRSILAVPLVRGRKVIGVLEVVNKTDESPFNDQDLRVLTGLVSTEGLILLVSMAATAISNIKLSQETLESCKNTVETLVTAADARDPYAWRHSQRVKKYTLLAAASFSLSADDLRVIEFGALLHDIGKIGINETILRKSGPLAAEEWYMIRKHPLRGANIVGQIPYLEKAREIVLYHHERYDGTGYPEGLKGDDIPLAARLVAVADAFDTMTTDHSYRSSLSVDDAMNELVKGKGTQFCPAAVTAFIAGFKERGDAPGNQEGQQEPSSMTATLPESASGAGQAAAGEVPVEAGDDNGSVTEPPQDAPKELTEKTLVELIGREVREEPAAAIPAAVAEAVPEKTPEASHETGPDVYEGEVQIVLPSPVKFHLVRDLQEQLGSVGDLRIGLVGGSAGEGAIIVVSATRPMALEKLLEAMPNVERVERSSDKGKQRIFVRLRDSLEGSE